MQYPRANLLELARILERTPTALQSRAKLLGVKRMGRHRWTDAENERLREIYPEARIVTLEAEFGLSQCVISSHANTLGIHRSNKYLSGPDAWRIRSGSGIGAAYRYRPGHVPANKGTRKPGWAPGRMSETQFKAGNRPHTWVPVGTEIRTKDGYFTRKMSDDKVPAHANWEPVHRLIWIETHGSIPSGHAVVFRDGDATHCVIDNLELVSRAELMRRNSVHRLPKALADIIQFRGALQRRINRRSKAREE